MARVRLPSLGAIPLGIVTGPDGQIWFTEQGANKLGRLSAPGTVTEFPIPTFNRVSRRLRAG